MISLFEDQKRHIAAECDHKYHSIVCSDLYYNSSEHIYGIARVEDLLYIPIAFNLGMRFTPHTRIVISIVAFVKRWRTVIP